MTVFLVFHGFCKSDICIYIIIISQIWDWRRPKNAVFGDINCQTLVQKTRFSNKRVTWAQNGKSKNVIGKKLLKTHILQGFGALSTPGMNKFKEISKNACKPIFFMV